MSAKSEKFQVTGNKKDPEWSSWPNTWHLFLVPCHFRPEGEL